MDRREKEKQKKINTKDKNIYVTQLMERYGYPQLTTMLVPNPNFGGKRKRKPKDL